MKVKFGNMEKMSRVFTVSNGSTPSSSTPTCPNSFVERGGLEGFATTSRATKRGDWTRNCRRTCPSPSFLPEEEGVPEEEAEEEDELSGPSDRSVCTEAMQNLSTRGHGGEDSETVFPSV